LAAAVLSSACCWLPLVAVGLGASSAGAGAFFAAWRGPLLLATASLLSVAFYLAYRRPRCAPGGACEVPPPGLRRLGRGTLWLTATAVAAFALFPALAGAFADAGAPVQEAAPAHRRARYRVEGMTCGGCAGHAREALEAIPGVVSASVSYRGGSAEIVWRGPGDDVAVVDALAALGYRAALAP
jgi:copper chaperone CopZ